MELPVIMMLHWNTDLPVFHCSGLFIIDDKGNLRQITINDLPVGRSIDETLRLVQAFQFTDKHGEGIVIPYVYQRNQGQEYNRKITRQDVWFLKKFEKKIAENVILFCSQPIGTFRH